MLSPAGRTRDFPATPRAGILRGMRILPNFDDPTRNVLREAWDKLAPLPGGKALFSTFVGRMAPYTGNIGARIEALEVGRARVVMQDRPAVRNHLKSVHAIALANLAELAGNIALVYSLPPDARFIVSGMQLDYLKKARGPITGIGTCPPVQSSARQEYQVSVSLQNAAGEEVTRAVLSTLVGPKRG